MSTGTRADILQYVTDIGRAGVNALFPNDFEYYAITLELTDSKGATIDYLTFPVSPESIDYSEMSLVNIKKTLGGITSLDTSTFIPKKYTLSGTFGRKLRLLISNAETTSHPQSTAKGQYSKQQGDLEVRKKTLNAKIKTGYGTTKLLEAIIDKSSGLDSYNKPLKLFLYNPTLNHNFLVKNNGLTLHQDKQTSNMLWKYTLNLTAIAPVDRLKLNDQASTSMLGSTTIDVLNKGANILTKNIRKSIF